MMRLDGRLIESLSLESSALLKAKDSRSEESSG